MKSVPFISLQLKYSGKELKVAFELLSVVSIDETIEQLLIKKMIAEITANSFFIVLPPCNYCNY